MTDHKKTESREESVKKIGEFIKEINFTMMTTIDENGELQSRPMATQKAEFDGTVWFFTYEDTHKIEHIKANQHVNLAYSSPADQTYVSLKGNAVMLKDRNKMEELWSPELKAWFPDGLETDGITLMKVTVETAEYWDSSSSMVAHAIGLVTSIVSGEQAHIGDNETVEIN